MSVHDSVNILETLAQFQINAISKSIEEIFKETSELDHKYGHYPTYTHNIDGVLVNIGTRKKSLCLLHYARKRLLHILLATKEDFPVFNLGNAMLAIGELKCMNSLEELMRSRELRKAREYFFSVRHGRSFPQAYTNLANILEKYGRNYEAIQVYDKVLMTHPTFGMALGNKAKALLFYFNLVADKNPELLFQAIELLKRAAEEDNTIEIGGHEALASFKDEIKNIDSFLSLNHIKKPSHKHSIDHISKYHRFCMAKNLFLNFCFNCFHCKRGFIDSFAFHFIDRPGDDYGKRSHNYSCYTRKTYYSLKILNQIYEDYATARYLYFQANTGRFRNYDRITRYNSALDYCCNSLRYGLIKTTYIRLFNILDKITHLVYTNYELGQKKVYITDMKSPEVEELIKEKRSWGLLALNSMGWDFQEGQVYHHLSQIRNSITHEFIDIKPILLNDEDEKDSFHRNHHISDDLLSSHTEELFLLVKSALMYFMNALYQDYLERRKQGEPLTLPIYPQKQFYN